MTTSMDASQLFLDGKVTLLAGDCLELLKALPEASIDSVVTDPPYHLTSIQKRYSNTTIDGDGTNETRARARADAMSRLAGGFMGKKWDGGDIAFRVDLWREVLRVLKPGGHMLAFSGTRTYHRMVCAIEDAGFEIRDQIGWAYGSGFPKSHDVSRGIDRAAGHERGTMPDVRNGPNTKAGTKGDKYSLGYAGQFEIDGGAVTAAAKQWQGWGTALKPAWEPICLARKPLIGTVAQNVLKHGTGAINIDGCRVESGEDTARQSGVNGGVYGRDDRANIRGGSEIGRWPANLIHDGSEEVLAAFPDARSAGIYGNERNVSEGMFGTRTGGATFDDSGSAARFFYTAKADSEDRLGSRHPTVKPLDLMQWLVRLVTPKGGTVFDCFAGTGTTGEAAWREGCRAILMEREPEYIADIERRMDLVTKPTKRAAVAASKNKLDDPMDLPLFSGG